MQKQALVVPVIMAMILWTGISWYWYTCSIKGFCKSEPVVMIDKANDVDDREDVRISSDETQNTSQRTETTESITTEEITIQCPAHIQSYIRLGYNNNSTDVRRLEEFLNTYEDENLIIDGTFSRTDEQAVQRFQLKYRAQVMDPWGMTTPSGYVFKTTLNQINSLYCAFQYTERNN